MTVKEEEEEEAENTGDGADEETISGDVIPGDIEGDEEGEDDDAFGDEMREAYGDEAMGSADDASDASGDFDLPPDDDDEMEMEEMVSCQSFAASSEASCQSHIRSTVA